MDERFDFIKPVENHPEELCCTECWQRGISWGSAGRTEEIIEILETAPADNYFVWGVLALIKGDTGMVEK